MIGSGLLSMEDGKLMKAFFASEEFKSYMSDVGEGFVTAFVDMGKDVVDLSKMSIKYGTEPSDLKMLRTLLIAGKFEEFLRNRNIEEKWEIISEGAGKIGKGIWAEFVEATTTGKGHGGFIAEAVMTFGVGRVLKGLKAVGEVVDEAIDIIPNEKTCPRELGLAERSDRFHIDAVHYEEDLKALGFKSPKNFEFYTKYKADLEFSWASEYNEWIKTIDPKEINLHHVLSNKGKAMDAIPNHPIFKDGLLDVKLLESGRNIMVLPTKPGLHPTMNVHKGGRHTNLYKIDMNKELSKIHVKYRNGEITRDHLELEFWEIINDEKTNLFKGKSKIYHKKGD